MVGTQITRWLNNNITWLAHGVCKWLAPHIGHDGRPDSVLVEGGGYAMTVARMAQRLTDGLTCGWPPDHAMIDAENIKWLAPILY